MRCVCVIPSRYGSTRLPGKPLLLINGKPMIYWVWKNCVDTNAFSEIVVATDDDRIKTTVESFGGRAIMTPSDCDSPSVRTWMISEIVEADYYIRVNGDEPLLKPETIVKCIPEDVDRDSITVTNLMTRCTNAADVIDVSNIKVVTDDKGAFWFFERYQCPRFTTPDEFGNVILDTCYFIKRDNRDDAN